MSHEQEELAFGMKQINMWMRRNLYNIFKLGFFLSTLSIIMFIYDLGFKHSIYNLINYIYESAIAFGIVSTILKHIYKEKPLSLSVKIFDLLSILFFSYILYQTWYLGEPLWSFAIFLTFIREFSMMKLNYGRNIINPAKLFVSSFLLIVLAGSFLLMLPQATQNGIDYLDALFISTSAVCVTGLSTVDFSQDFTIFGQTVVLILIQIGGLGIMTFASYFSYFFRGSSSYQNQLTLGEFTNDTKLGDVFSTIRRIVLITLIIEFLGAMLIFFATSSYQLGSGALFFSVFHSISAFCNAGFSTLPEGLYNPNFRYDYNLQLIISGLIVFGGLGFPIVHNIYKYVLYRLRNLYRKVRGKESVQYQPWLLNLNSRITLITAFSLLLFGFITFFFFEYNASLKGYDVWGKITGAIFGSVTPRTAGFNTIDMAKLSFPTLMIYFLLMWIGASPGSTGGGIKTSTFAIAVLNFISLAKGKNRIEVYRREISQISISRAFATAVLSLLVIGISIGFIESFEHDKGLLAIAFECFSAYSTVGLSLGITPELSSFSKIVIIFVMFIGRVSMLSILIAFMKREKFTGYKYPTEDILIN